MLLPPRLRGPNDLRAIVDAIRFNRSCQLVDVTPTTMRRWLRGATPVPTAPLQALYWLSPFGASDAFAAAHYVHQHLTWRLRTLESIKTGTTSIPAVLPANDPVWNGLRPRRLVLVQQ